MHVEELTLKGSVQAKWRRMLRCFGHVESLYEERMANWVIRSTISREQLSGRP